VRKTPFWRKPLVWVLAALFFGIATGAGSASAREVEVIKEVPVEKIVEKEVEVAVPTTPQACLDVITVAGKLIAVNIAIQDIQSDALTAVANSDVPAINRATEKVKIQNAVLDELTAPWSEAVEGCRAAS
jgi:hypothetical protein